MTFDTINITCSLAVIGSNNITLYNVSYTNGNLRVNNLDEVLWNTANTNIDSSRFPYLTTDESLKKVIDTDLPTRVTGTIVIQADSSSSPGNIIQTSSGGISKTFYPTDYIQSGNDITLGIDLDPSNTLTIQYGCSSTTKVGYRLIAIFSAAMLPIFIVMYVRKKGWDKMELKDILIFFVAIIIGVGLILASWQNLGASCGALAT